MHLIERGQVIGHVRYATCGDEDRNYAQPFERHHLEKRKWFAFGFNGQLANYQDLKANLLADCDYHLARDNDTEMILHEISRGAMGVVHKAVETETNREVALKILLPGMASSSDGRRRFEQEARALRKLDHPNIIRIFETGVMDGKLFLAMELVEGKTLRELLASELGLAHPIEPHASSGFSQVTMLTETQERYSPTIERLDRVMGVDR